MDGIRISAKGGGRGTDWSGCAGGKGGFGGVDGGTRIFMILAGRLVCLMFRANIICGRRNIVTGELKRRRLCSRFKRAARINTNAFNVAILSERMAFSSPKRLYDEFFNYNTNSTRWLEEHAESIDHSIH